MPKQTFFNLPKIKQDNIIKAAIKEFSRVSLNEASISNIISTADIPRGSFYQYFEDKSDLYFYVISDFARTGEKVFLDRLEKNNGDLIEAFIQVYGLLLVHLEKDEKNNFYKNVFLNMNHKTEDACHPGFSENSHGHMKTAILSLVDIKKLNIKEEPEIVNILKVIKAITILSIAEVYAKNLSAEEGIEKYKTLMRLVKEGIYKIQ